MSDMGEHLQGIKKIQSIEGRDIYDKPGSYLLRPRPSDKPTVIFKDDKSKDIRVDNNIKEVPKENKIEVPVLSGEANPGTTVLGMGLFDDEDVPEQDTFTEPSNEYTDKQEQNESEEVKPLKEIKENIESKKVQVNPKINETKSTTKKKQTSAKPRAPRYSKLVLVRQSNGEIIKISKKNYIIGKSKYSDYQLTDNNTISRSHITAHKLPDGSLTIEDNESKNGTFLDGVRLKANEATKVKSGQTIRLSDEDFKVKLRSSNEVSNAI